MDTITVPYSEAHATELLTNGLSQRIYNHQSHREIVFLCIGTDRSTGDALGPLIGSKLEQIPSFVSVYGNLDEPVHAVNLVETLQMIRYKHQEPYIIAIDACLGRLKNVGMITLREGPLRPGSGVKKELPEVGDLHITGNVNVGGFMEFFVLQNTRLSLVMKMADVISTSIIQSLHNIRKMPLRYHRTPIYDENELYQRNHHSLF